MMTRIPGSPRYEIVEGRLHVNGERQTVQRATVLAAAALYRAESKDPLEWAPEESVEIPEELACFILGLEARKAVRELEAALVPILAA